MSYSTEKNEYKIKIHINIYETPSFQMASHFNTWQFL